MTVHMLRIYAEFPDGYTIEEIRDAVQNWADDHTPWSDDAVQHTVDPYYAKYRDMPEDALKGDFRFEWSEDAATVLDTAEQTLQDSVAWYRIGYHQCDHDDVGEDRCSFDSSMTREHNPDKIPPGVPDFT